MKSRPGVGGAAALALIVILGACAGQQTAPEPEPLAAAVPEAEPAVEPVVVAEPAPAPAPRPVAAPEPEPAPEPAVEAEPAEPEPEPAAEPVAEPPIHDRRALILDGAMLYTVRWGDTLAGLAAFFYGKSAYFPLIALASDKAVVDMDDLLPGERLVLPNLEKNKADPGVRAGLKEYFEEVAAVYAWRGRQKDAAAIRAIVAGW